MWTARRGKRTTSAATSWRRGRRLLLAGVVAAGVWAAVAAVQVGVAWSELSAARAAGTQGAEALLAGEAATAGPAFADAQADLAAAERRLRGPALAPVRAVPLLGGNVEVAASLAGGGRELAAAGYALATGVAEQPGGLSALLPADGVIPLDRLSALQPALTRARRAVERADAQVADVAPEGLIRAVAQRQVDLRRRVEGASKALEAGSALVDALPEFLGAEGPRRYFLGAQNPAELRGTGGLIGGYAIMTIHRGRVDIGEFKPVQELDTVPAEDAPAPEPAFAARYNRYGGAGYWLNINMTPHGPWAATAIEELYREVAGTELDGTVLVTPELLARVLEVTGPVEVPGTDLAVDADNAVSLLTNEAYSEIREPAARKRLLGRTAGRALRRLLATGFDSAPSAGLRAMGEAAADGDLLLHARDDRVQAAFERADVAGSLDPEGTDFLGMVVNNASVNKTDHYSERTVHYEVDLHADGSASSRVRVDVRNHAPENGERYVVGPNIDSAAAGENRSLVSVYCAPGCERRGFRRSVGREPLRQERELGFPVSTTMLRLPSGEAGRVELAFDVANAWERREGHGVYELSLRGQQTVRATRTEVVVRVPQGMRVQSVDPPGEVSPHDVRWVTEGLWERTFRVAFDTEGR